MEIIGYIAAVFMGMTLGIIGGGGSILTVPILVYLMGVSPSVATGYSLLIVGSAAAFGAYRYYKKGLIQIKTSLIFALPSIIAVYCTRAFLMPIIPQQIQVGSFSLNKDMGIMVLFACLMVLSAVMMFRNSKKLEPPKSSEHHYILIVVEGAVVGVATGVLGAGGGFLIIPALVLLIGMPMKQAVGASLFIITLKSLIGFVGDLQSGIDIQMPMLTIFLTATLGGMYIATQISHKIEGQKLQKAFAIFTLFIASIILIKELV